MKTMTFNLLNVTPAMIALMYGIEAYNQLKKNEAITHRSRYWFDFSDQPRRTPGMKPLLQNGKTPR